MFKATGLAAAVVIGWTPFVQADFNDEVRRCEMGGGHPDIRIVACTRNILSGRFAGKNLAIAYANRALGYKRKGQLDHAIADYDEAIRLNPTFVFALNNRANALYGKGQLDAALADYTRAIRLMPAFAEALSNRGNVYRKKGRFAEALKDYEAAIRLDPENARTFADRGLAYEKKGEPTRALQDFKRAHALGFRHSLLMKKLRESGEIL